MLHSRSIPHDLQSLCIHLTPTVQLPCSISSFSEGGMEGREKSIGGNEERNEGREGGRGIML